MKLTSCNGRLSCLGCLLALPWLFMLVLLAGCPQGGTGNDNNNGNDNTVGSGQGRIVTPASSFGLSLLDLPFQVRYNVPSDATDIRGYRFAVADSSLNSPAIGDEVTIAVGLQAGSDRLFTLILRRRGLAIIAWAFRSPSMVQRIWRKVPA